MSTQRSDESRSDCYATFVRRHFPAIYRWCEQYADREQCAHVAQRIILDLYRLEYGAPPVS